MKSHLRWLLPGDNTRLLAVATFIGLISGVLNIVFRITVQFVEEFFFKGGKELLRIDHGGLHLLLLPLIPVTGMILLIPLSLLFPGEVNGYGFTKFLRKVNLEGGYIRSRTIFLKIVSTALTIGTGNSAGVEGPIAQIGGAMGSQVGQFFHVSGDRMKLYIAAGCAGGIAGMFNAPIAGVFFAAEIVLLGTYEISSFSALITASAISTVVTRSYFGEANLFVIPQYYVVNPFIELPLYALLAVITGFIAVFHTRVFYSIRDCYRNLKIPNQLKPITGAVIVGTIGIMFPQVMGDGYHAIEAVLYGSEMNNLLISLIFLKIFATAVTLGSGGAGGLFAPALFIGTMIGGSFGSFVHRLFPDITAGPGAYASVGIGAFLAASTHAPLTAIFLLFEMTGNYKIIVPAMLASIIGTVVATKLDEDSIDTVDFSREGINIHEGREVAIMKSLKVGLAITEDINFISEEADINQLLLTFSESKDGFYFPVIDESGKMTGIVSMTDVKKIIHRDSQARSEQTVGSICHRDIIMLTPDDTLYTAMELFDIKGIEEIPVVESLDNQWVLGMLKRRSVISAYNREVLRKGISEKVGSIRVSAQQQ
ncbi:chloride channel protein [Desulfopila sp. IMCC35006]|uniref:chloride channel protein n=1 Tax=Desulfopila sp. IMCC35006 TaxID=2569542 RepID=UPI0010AB5E5E|nr:chloride channel protein [Desulfopila sp. IMCC35006]TKB24260.1 chloride channel protein [Desulfopila sp. IMCC35006]